MNLEPTLKDDILRLHILYLEKLDHLSKGERGAFEMYFKHLSQPVFTVDTSMDTEKFKDMASR